MPSAGQVINDSFIVRDNGNVAITGLTSGSFSTVEAYLISNPATTATVTIGEIGSGEYRFTFTPSVPGDWSAHVIYDSPPVYREFAQTYQVDSTGVVALNGAFSIPLSDLRRRVLRRLGDGGEILTATSNGTTTTFIDALNVSSAAENRDGQFITPLTGTAGNIGKTARVTTTTDASNRLTFTPAFPFATAVGDVIETTNYRGIGFRPDQIVNAINDAINDAYPLGLIEVSADVNGFNADPPGTVVVPLNMREVYDVAFIDSAGYSRPLRIASRTNRYGVSFDAVAGTINIAGVPAIDANNNVLRLFGYARQPALALDSDVCLLNAEYIVSRACYHLALAKISSDPSYGQMVSVFLKESEMLRSRVRTQRKPGTTLVRSI